MRRYVAIFFCIVSVFWVSEAQQQRGDTELQIIGYYFTTTASPTIKGGNIQTKFGKFLSNHFEIGIYPSLSITSVLNSTKTTFGGGAFAQYTLLSKNANVVPYLGFEYFNDDFDKGNASLGGSFGLKFYFNYSAAFDVSGGYYSGLGSNKSNSFPIKFGISFLW